MPNLSQVASRAEKILPPGVVLPHGSSSIPDGFLACDGSAVSRATYAALFAAISTTYGAGDGTSTFNVPDLRGIFPRGVGSQTISAVNYDGSTLGTKRKDRTNNTGLSATTTSTNSAAVSDFNAAHTHTWNDRYFTAPVTNNDSYSNEGAGGETIAKNYTNNEIARTTGNPNVSLNHSHTVATNTVSSSSSFSGENAETVPGYLTVAYIIKV